MKRREYGTILDASRMLHYEGFTLGSRLDKAFDDSQKITKAINKLNSIQQRNRSFREFLQDFERILLEAQAWEWTDDAKKVSQAEPQRYDDFVSQLRTTSDKMEAVKAWDAKKGRNHSAIAQPPSVVESQEKIDVIDWEPSPPVNVSAAHRNFNEKTNKNPRARATCVSQEGIGRRISEGLCIRCGSRGHIIK
ncbi:hypothetical protein Golomagni_04925 [Golovinomyces magnicellulatus]|nr:hypothetical protein Golomagni_04925 [Golovinomyces magnicellulatus]